MKIQNPFRLGLLAGLGVLVAILIGTAVGSLATILTYIGAAIFLALGLDPFVTWLERRKVKRPIAILISLVAVLGIFTGLVFAIIPVLVKQIQSVVTLVTDTIVPSITNDTLVHDIAAALPWIDKATLDTIFEQVGDFFSNPDNIANISAGVLQVGIGIASGTFGAIIVVILMIYFVASLASLKRGVYQLVPASKREGFIDLAEQITASVGRYVMGQISLALINGVLSFIVLTFIFQVENSALLAFIAFLGSLIPLVGTLSASVLIILGTLLFEGPGWQVIAVAIYYVVYMQVEAYVINPRIMASAVQVPGVVVVIAALVGGTLLGVLGALIAIPVAAAIQLIMKDVIIPRQNEL
jgi:predicted PurR-regulated permease PerM